MRILAVRGRCFLMCLNLVGVIVILNETANEL